MQELLGNEQLLNIGEGESEDSGSDSAPSEDNLELDELAKYVPPANYRKNSPEKRKPLAKRRIIRTAGGTRSMSGTKPSTFALRES